MNFYKSSSILSFMFIILIGFPNFSISFKIRNQQYLNCSQPFQCGNLTSTGYPFWGYNRQGYCGLPGFKLDCPSSIPKITIMKETYRVLDTNEISQTLTIAREDLWNNICPARIVNTTLDFSLFSYSSDTTNLTLQYNCPVIPDLSNSQFNCAINGTKFTSYYVTNDFISAAVGDRLRNCSSSIVVYLYQQNLQGLENGAMDLVAALNSGFGLKWTINNSKCEGCTISGGQCGYDSTTNGFTCYCPDQPYASRCPPDRRLVAVKVLTKSKGNGEEFINEVASISKTSHVNVVTLLGFCYEKNRGALIYEFMPNGSLDKYIYDDKANSHLDWQTLYQIAIGIARGLEYLHLGCNTRILHFDIKPHNILLDENFHPKISDFGLAKLCQTNESMVSMIGARGTIGYIAPEIFCRIFGGVSHKSDVYSYGMMVLEMVGGRKNFDARKSQSSEEYFPDWIYKQLEPGENIRVNGVMTKEEEETVRKMIVVSLWCIQTNPSDRPSMSKVVEMLVGSIHSLSVPPKPTLSTSTESYQTSSTTIEQSSSTISINS